MNAKQATFAILNRLPDGAEIGGVELCNLVRHKLGNRTMDATTNRYLRIYRGIRNVSCISKPKSLYRIGA